LDVPQSESAVQLVLSVQMSSVVLLNGLVSAVQVRPV
jgi:hypothetical protein